MARIGGRAVPVIGAGDQRRHFIQSGEHFTCYVPDLPGLGETRWTDRTDFRFAAQAKTLKAFTDTLGLSSYAVVAHDTGGTVARRLAVIDRDRVTRMSLIGTEIPGHRRLGSRCSRKSLIRIRPERSSSRWASGRRLL